MALLTRLRILGAIAVLILTALLWLAFRPQPVPVDLATVTRGPLEVTVEAEGVTRIRQVYEVSAPLAGYTARSPVEVGDPVTAFETVVAAMAPVTPAFLDARAREEAEAAVTEGEAALRAAEARVEQRISDLDYAKSQHDRAAALAGRGVIPQSSLDDAELRLRVAETALDAARSEREMAEATLARARAALIGPLSSVSPGAEDACCVEITAPASGHVLSIVNRSARLVQPGEPLLEIGEPGDLEIEVDLLSSDAVRIAPGAAAYVERWGGPALGRASAASTRPPSPRSPPSASRSSAFASTSISWTRRRSQPRWETASGYTSGSSSGAARMCWRCRSHRSFAARTRGRCFRPRTAAQGSPPSRSAGATPRLPKSWKVSPTAIASSLIRATT